MGDTNPIDLQPRRLERGALMPANPLAPVNEITRFNRFELDTILRLYGRMVAAGEWRDYAIDMNRHQARFAVYRRSSEVPLYTIIKDQRLARRQGPFTVVAATGLILKRGHDLARVLSVLDKPKLVPL